MTKEILTPPKNEALEIISGDHEDFKTISEEIVDTTRWSIMYCWIGQRKDGKFFRADYSRGATEQQDERPFEYDSPEFTEVFPVQKTITVYE